MARGSSKGDKIKRCFIAAAVGTDVSELRSLLEARGISTIVGAEMSLASPIYEALRGEISKADMVIGVKSGEANSSNLMFELGVAAGANKPALLVAGRSGERLPSDLVGVPVVFADSRDIEAIKFHLDQFLASPAAARYRDRPETSTSALGERADQILAQLPKVGETVDERKLEELVVEALREAGAKSTRRSEVEVAGKDRPDIAIWSDDLSNVTGNPLIAEIKTDVSSEARLQGAQQQLLLNIQSSGASWGLMMYLRGPDSIPDSPPILNIRIDGFLRELRSRPLDAVLRERRDKAVHKVSD